MKNMVITLFSAIIGGLLWIACMMWGWGLEPQSWWWILGGYFGLRALVLTLEHLAKEDK